MKPKSHKSSARRSAEDRRTVTARARPATPPVTVPTCAASMGCLCAGHARGAAPTAPCSTAERVIRCPACGEEDLKRIAVRETYSAFHPIDHAAPVDGKPGENGVVISNALGSDVACPSEHFDDGEGDLRGYCKSCDHTAELEEFGIDAITDWT